MPRTTDILLSRYRLKKFTNYKHLPLLKEKRPLVLADQVSNRGEGRKVKPCLQEISLMLVCLRENDFSEMKCSKEIEAFNRCQQEFDANIKRKKESEAKGLMVSSQGRLPSRQVNSLLKKYPQPK